MTDVWVGIMAITVTTHGPVWTATDVVVILRAAASPGHVRLAP